jgi:glutamine amidotransferase
MIGIVDYGMGNLRSVAKAFELIGAEVIVSGIPDELLAADRLVLPGVGAFGDGMANLKRLGLDSFLNSEVIEKKKPILGICLGMQLMAREGFERGHHTGLGWIDAKVSKFQLGSLKVPHVGWNEVSFKQDIHLFRGMRNNSCFYFVHSYHVICDNPEDVSAVCEYGYEFTASVRKGNIFGTQFHPEKSQEAGLKVLENYLEMGVS